MCSIPCSYEMVIKTCVDSFCAGRSRHTPTGLYCSCRTRRRPTKAEISSRALASPQDRRTLTPSQATGPPRPPRRPARPPAMCSITTAVHTGLRDATARDGLCRSVVGIPRSVVTLVGMAIASALSVADPLFTKTPSVKCALTARAPSFFYFNFVSRLRSISVILFQRSICSKLVVFGFFCCFLYVFFM